MKNNEAKIFIFTASIFIGVLISLNLSFNKNKDRTYLSSKEYLEAYNQKNKLYSELNNLDRKLKINQYKLNKYLYTNNDNDKDNSVIKQVQSELEESDMFLGKTELEGPGIVITLNDSTEGFSGSIDERNFRIVHNTDVLGVINDLRIIGAEAIDINGQRIIDKTEVYCNGPFIRVNRAKLKQPFYISAIGDPKVLKNYMLQDENYLKYLELRKIFVEVEEKDSIKIPPYEGNFNKKYMEDIKK